MTHACTPLLATSTTTASTRCSLDKDEWSHVPWSEPFVDIEGVARKPIAYPRTRFKMMHDATHVYIGAELLETQIWGTLRTKNSTMYHENDFEVFLNCDGSRHHY